MELRVAVAGCGKVADMHAEEIQKMPGIARIVAAYDLELLMAEQLSSRYNIPKYYDDMDKMLSIDRPDVVHITTPPHSHLSLATKALDAGCHVYVEKPFTMNYDEAVKLIEHALQAERKLTIGYTFLLDPPALAMREILANDLLGEPIHVESFYSYDLGSSYGTALLSDSNHWVHRLPGKLFHNNLDHLLSKITEFIDDDQPEIAAFSTRRRQSHLGDVRDDMHDELRLLIRGERTTAYGTFSAHTSPGLHFCRVYGTKNTIHVDYAARTVTFERVPREPTKIGQFLPAFEQAVQFTRQGMHNMLQFVRGDFHPGSGLNRLIKAYYRSILDDKPPPVAYRDILRISAMLDEIWRQTVREQP